MKVIAYCRASPGSPNPKPQLDEIKRWAALNRHVVVGEFEDDQVSGKDFNRPNWALAKAAVGSADAIVCTKLDRFGRSIKHIREEVDWLAERGKGLVTIDGTINTTLREDGPAKAFQDLTLNLLGAIAEFERALINERTSAGRARALARGVKFGRPTAKLDREVVLAMRRDGHSLRVISEKFGCSSRSVGRALKRWGDPKKMVTVIDGRRLG